MKKYLLFLVACALSMNCAYAQGTNSYVRDTVLLNKLRKYLIAHIDVYTVDSLGRKLPLDANFIKEEYGQTVIVATNLKSDSAIHDKSPIGIYSFRFAEISSSPHLYFKYSDKIEFIELDDAKFNLNKLMKKILKFFDGHANQFTLQERLKTIQGVMETIYFNKFAKYSW